MISVTFPSGEVLLPEQAANTVELHNVSRMAASLQSRIFLIVFSLLIQHFMLAKIAIISALPKLFEGKMNVLAKESSAWPGMGVKMLKA
jgi:hypothetical protein